MNYRRNHYEKTKENPDRWNLAKFKILKVLSNSEDMNSIQISKRTMKTVYATAMVLKRLLKQGHVRQKACNTNNDGCSFRYRLTPKGRRYLLDLQSRFINSQSLNFKYDPYPVQYRDIDLVWWEREKAIEKQHLDEILENRKKPLSIEHTMNEINKQKLEAIQSHLRLLEIIKKRRARC